MRAVLLYTIISLSCHTSAAFSSFHVSNGVKSRAIILGARRRPGYFNDEYYDDDDDDYYYTEDRDEYYNEEQPYGDTRPPPLELEVDMETLEQDDEDAAAGVYKVSFDDPQEEVKLDWEESEDGTMVLLPPPFVSCPKSVIHFVGGTFFGSTPQLWYRTLLEGIVRTTSSVVIATPIPVTLLRNPLHHVRISRQLQRKFKTAFIEIVQDEYGDALVDNTVPVVGMGHSLGARLLTVLATLDSPKQNKNTNGIPPYQSYILMSFTNYGSAASIPGIQSLLRQSRRLENNNNNNNKNEDKRRRNYNYNDDMDDEDDEEWEELLQDLASTWNAQATRVKTALTPASKELEFYPSPKQLWQALQDDGRYTIPQTLVVQFDLDEIDTSPRLTDCLLECSTDIRYCRLRGTHLTPISAGSHSSDGSSLLERSKQTTRALWKLVRGKQSTRMSGEQLRDLRLSISRYITDVVAAPSSTSATSASTTNSTLDESTATATKTSVETESL